VLAWRALTFGFFQIEFATSKGRWEGAVSSNSSLTQAVLTVAASFSSSSPLLNHLATTLASST